MFLIDTNIFLEILLKQEKSEICKKFLSDNSGNLCITDFSLHSIGIILFRYNKEDVFKRFIEDFLPNTRLFSLPLDLYNEIITNREIFNLDFDDAYQYCIAKHNGLKFVTMDKDFQKAKGFEVLYF